MLIPRSLLKFVNKLADFSTNIVSDGNISRHIVLLISLNEKKKIIDSGNS